MGAVGSSEQEDGAILLNPYGRSQTPPPQKDPAGNNQWRNPSWHMEGEVSRTRERSREKNKVLQEEELQRGGCKSTSWRHTAHPPLHNSALSPETARE